PTKCKIELTKCKTGGVSGFYGMQEIKATQDIVCITAADIEGLLNVQHNCYEGCCIVQKTCSDMIER
ncbi:hypothetical protein DFH28DRAFT_840737, partial [Melampsora americana]